MRSLVLIISLLFAFVSTQGQGAMFLRGSQPAPTPGAGILDSYPGAAFAAAPDVLIYSSHSVTDNTVGSQTEGQTGPYTVLVRRDNDDALRSFTYTEVSDGTLTTWVGPANNGFVQILYDQSTNGNHATQSTATSQPKIYDSSTGIIYQNLLVAMNFDGANDRLFFSNALTAGVSDHSIFFVSNTLSNSGYIITSSSTLTGPTEILIDRNNYAAYVQSSPIGTAFSSSYILGSLVLSSTGSTYQNGTLKQSGLAYTQARIKSTGAIGGWDYGFKNGKIQLVLIYPSDQSANRTAIETAINNYFSIY